jgi:hypothetical protein
MLHFDGLQLFEDGIDDLVGLALAAEIRRQVLAFQEYRVDSLVDTGSGLSVSKMRKQKGRRSIRRDGQNNIAYQVRRSILSPDGSDRVCNALALNVRRRAMYTMCPQKSAKDACLSVTRWLTALP